MKKTGSEVENDITGIIASSALKTAIGGNIYKEGQRPLNSKDEDIVISFLTGQDGQKQTGVVNVNIYVPNIKSDRRTGELVKHTSRIRQLEIIANQVVGSIVNTEYDFSLGAMIQSFMAEGIDQHFINVKLKFSRITI